MRLSKLKKSSFINFLLLFGSVVLALFISEIILRVLKMPLYYVVPRDVKKNYWENFVHQKSSIPGLDYELRPGANAVINGIHIKINSFGLRDDEFTIDQLFSSRRVAFLGDSRTFGFGVEAEDSYVEILEQLLNRKFGSNSYQVLNFGVAGYSTKDEAIVLRHKVKKFAPELVIIGYSINDPEIDPVQPLHSFYHEHSFWQYSNLLSMLVWAKDQIEIYLLGDGDYFRYLYCKPRKWQSVVNAFDDMGKWSKENHIPILLVIFPCITPPFELWPTNYKYKDIHQKVYLEGTKAGFKVFDLYYGFSFYPAFQLVISEEDAHPSPFGHKLAGRLIFEFLMANYPELFR